MSCSKVGHPETSAKRPASVVARAGLFVALSALAVPACQHFDGTDDKSAREQAARVNAPPARESGSFAVRTGEPRA